MPISFEQPGPFVPGIANAYGAAEQFDRSLPALVAQQGQYAQIQENAARIAAQGAEAGANRLAAGSSQAAHINAQLAMQGREQAGRAQMAQAQMQHQGEMQQQHFQLQNQLADSQLTRGEQLRLERLRNALGSVQGDTTLTDEERHDLALQLRTGIDPLQQRQERARTLMMQAQHQALQQHTAQQDMLMSERNRFMTTNAQGLVETVTDEATGVEHSFRRAPNGDVIPLGPNAGYGAGGRGGGTGGGTGGAERGGTGGERMNTSQVLAQATRNAERMAGRDENGRQIAPTQEAIQREEERLLALVRPDERVPDRAAVRQQVWQDVRRMFPNASIAERHQIADRLTDQRMSESQQGVVPQARAALTEIVRRQLAGRIYPTGGTEPAISDQVERQLREHFGTRYTPPPTQGQQQAQQGQQRDAATTVNAYRQAIEQDRTLTPESRTDRLQYVSRMQEIANRWGGIANIQGRDRQEWDQMEQILSRRGTHNPVQSEQVQQPANLGTVANLWGESFNRGLGRIDTFIGGAIPGHPEYERLRQEAINRGVLPPR